MLSSQSIMLVSYPLSRRSPGCSKGSNFSKYRVFISMDEVSKLDLNEVFIKNFICTKYHTPKEGYLEFSYVTRCRLSKSKFISILSSMGVVNYYIPEDQHIYSKYWNK